jgi:phosphoesterase RecJ-like protein
MNQLLQTINQNQKIAITGHIRPDGDCVGAVIALYQYINDNYSNKEVTVFLEEINPKFQFLSGTEHVLNQPNQEQYDAMIILDASDLDRIGAFVQVYKNSKYTVVIDHHISNKGYGDVSIIEPEISSASELLYTLLEPDKISLNAATALYMGIVHDTGVFKFSNVSCRTMEIAGKLLDIGVDNTMIIDHTFFAKTYIQNQLLGRAILESIMVLDGKCIFSYIKNKYFDFYGASYQDLEGVVEQLRITKGVEVAILITEIEPGVNKVSMRSNQIVDVNDVASRFGGGGHIRAAGCTMEGTIYDVVNNLTLYIEAQLKENDLV